MLTPLLVPVCKYPHAHCEGNRPVRPPYSTLCHLPAASFVLDIFHNVLNPAWLGESERGIGSSELEWSSKTGDKNVAYWVPNIDNMISEKVGRVVA